MPRCIPLNVFMLAVASHAYGETPSLEKPLTRMPELRRAVEAVYPPKALAAGIEAYVVLELDLGIDGHVERASVIETSSTTDVRDWGFVSSATTAAQALEFSPAEIDGVPVGVRIAYTFDFKLPTRLVDTASTARVASPHAGIANLRGIFREAGTRKRLPGILVTVFKKDGETAHAFEAVTKEDGAFEFYDLAPGAWSIRGTARGYHPFSTSEEIASTDVVEATYYIEKSAYNPYDVLVEAERSAKEVNRRSIPKAEIVRVPGTLGDPVNVVENMPGVARTPLGGGAIMVRGSGPEDTGIYIDGILVPLIYHFGALRSVIPADIVESIDFFPGNYSVSFGRAMGGVFDAHVKRLAPDQLHGSVDLSLLDVGLYVEVPIGKDAAIALAGRRSHVDAVIAAAASASDSIDLLTAPRYYDYQIFGNWRATDENEFRVLFFGSSDALSLLFEDPADLDAQLRQRSLDASTAFNRVSVEHRWTSPTGIGNRIRASYGRDILRSSLGDQFRADLTLRLLQVRDIAEWKIVPSIVAFFGIDLLAGWADVHVIAPRPPKEGDRGFNTNFSDVLETNVADEPFIAIAPFVEADWKALDRLHVIPGIRLDYHEQIDETGFDPRIVLRYELTRDWTLDGGVGITHQPPQPHEVDEVFGNPDLGLQSSVQYSLGAKWKALDYLRLEGTLFLKDMHDLVSRSEEVIVRDGTPTPKVYDNGGRGLVYGFELFVKHDFSHNFRGWLTYTLSRAERTESGESSSRLFSFDQTHIVGLVGSYTFAENWELGLRFRLVSGNPETPIVGSVFESDLDRYAPIPGDVNSERLPFFHQLDLRIEKRWVWDLWSLSAYLSLTNAYNNRNIEGIAYNFDWTERQFVGGMPIFPILGIRGEL